MSGDAPAVGGPAGSALRVSAGIFASRIIGFLRDRAIAHYFGAGPFADVFRTALRGPNILQNLLGEGTISAAFIPTMSRMLDDGREEDAGRFAGAVFGLLLALAATLALLGVVLARPLVALFASGLMGDAALVASGELTVDRFELTVQAVRIIFPMTGVLVLSAWALGVLNSHRRFFLAYLAPVLWNAAIIAALYVAAQSLPELVEPDTEGRRSLLMAACWGALLGGVLQFAVQVPLVVRLLRGFRLSLSTRVEGVREALYAFGPVVAGRGVYQLSAYIDLWLASWLTAGAIGALGWAQALYVLPVSLFGLSVAAAELPELSRAAGRGEGLDAAFLERVRRSLRQMAFLTAPTAVGYVAFGFLIVGALYRTGSFGVSDNWLVYLVLAGYSLGLLATTSSRLLQNAFYALDDTRTPARVAVVRVVMSALVAAPLMLWLDRMPLSSVIESATGRSLALGAVGLSLASAIAAWTELGFLARSLGRRVPNLGLPVAPIASMVALGVTAALPAAALWYSLPALHPALTAAVVVGAYAAIYLVAAWRLGMSEANAWLGRISRRL